MNLFKRGKVLVVVLLLCDVVVAQQQKIDSLFTLLKADKEDTSKVNHLIAICWQYHLREESDKAITYGDSAIVLAKRLNYTRGYAHACSNIGSVYIDKAEYLKAQSFLNTAMDIYKQLNYKKGIIVLNDDFGKLYDEQGNYPKALEYYFKALNEGEDIADKLDRALYIGDIGVVYYELGEYDKALKYDTLSLKFEEQSNNKYNSAVSLGNIGMVYDVRKEYDKAMQYYKKAISVQRQLGDSAGIARNTVNIGLIFESRGNDSAGLRYCMRALEIFKNLEDKKSVIVVMGDIGELYMKEKKYTEAENYLIEAYTASQNMGDMEGIRDDGKNLSELYEAIGNVQKELYYYKQYISAKDSLLNLEKSKELGQIEAKAEFDKELAIQQAESDRNTALEEAKSSRQKVIILLTALIALTAVVIALIIFRSLKTTRKQKIIAEKQKIAQELKALRAQMNPHFIFNAINSIKNVVLENDSAAASRHLSKFSKLMREVLENSKYENITLAKEIQMLELYMELEQLRFSNKFVFHIEIDNAVNSENVLISPLIIQPYVENAIWHGLMYLENKKGEVIIKIEKYDEDMLKCTIDDNGVGREKSMALKQKDHKSMGLSITSERLEIINSMNKSNLSVTIIDKKDDKGLALGTCVELFLPFVTEYA